VKLRALLAATVVLVAMVTTAQAVQLVVLSVNSTAIAGDKVFTIGVKVAQADVTAGGPNGPIFAQNVTFTGSANGPIHAAASGNVPDVAAVQAKIDGDTANNPQAPGGIAGPAAGFTAAGTNTSLFKDSWWYNASGGSLQGIIDSSGDSGTMTTNPATDGSGIYTISNSPGTSPTGAGGTAAVGVTGYTFAAQATGIVPANAVTGQTMQYTGLFGPLGANGLDQPPLAGQFVGGFLTVPLAQIIVKGNVALPDTYNSGTGTFLSIGNKAYDLSGAPAGTDTTATLNFASNSIVFTTTPEPGTMVLAGLGMVGLLFAWRRRK